MQTHIIEATNNFNWGKFMIARFDVEWAHTSHLDDVSEVPAKLRSGLLQQRGWSPEHIWVMDLETGEGALFLPGGSAPYDLEKHRIWVCPMFEPFLIWLYEQDLSDLTTLPHAVRVEGESSLAGYRRPGPEA